MRPTHGLLRTLRRPNSRKVKPCGFTLLEALMAVVILGLIASAMGGFYLSGMQALDAQRTRIFVDSTLRSQLEKLVSSSFTSLSSGSTTVSVEGKNQTVAWTVSNVDLNGDSVPELNAKQVTVTLGDRSLTTLVVDTGGKVGKL